MCLCKSLFILNDFEQFGRVQGRKPDVAVVFRDTGVALFVATVDEEEPGAAEESQSGVESS